jgi:ectoine hydroxylase-related dioxygenase (phytanoyl-CoA dioxygenase family)
MSSLRYLSEEQKKFWDSNGYLILENFSSADDITTLKQQIRKVIDNTDPSSIQGVFATGVKQLVRDYRNPKFATY